MISACSEEEVVEVPLPPRAVTTTSILEGRPRSETRATAVIEPYRQSAVGVDVDGILRRIVDLGADVEGPQLDGTGELLLDSDGEPVRRGEVIAVIDDTRYLEAVAAAELAIASTRRSRQATELQIERVLDPRVESALATRGSAEADVRAAREALAAAESDLDLAATTVERDRALIVSGAVAESVLETSEASFRSANAAIRQARASLDSARQAQVSAVAGISEAEGAIVVQRAELDVFDAQLAELQNDLRRARTDLERCLLRAPFSGRVTGQFASPGSYVAPGEPILELTLLSPVKVVLTASSEQERRLPLGATVALYGDDGQGDNSTYEATVFEKSSVADSGTRTYRVGLILQNEFLAPDARDPSFGSQGVQAFFPVLVMPGSQDGRRFINVRSVFQRGGQSAVLRIPRAAFRAESGEPARSFLPLPTSVSLGERWLQVDGWSLRDVVSGEIERGDVLVLDPTPDASVEVRLGAPSYVFRPGDVIQVGLDVGLPGIGLWVPADAIVERAGANRVFVVEAGVAQERQVMVVESSGTFRRVESNGLHASARVVHSGVHLIRDGDLVNVFGDSSGEQQ